MVTEITYMHACITSRAVIGCFHYTFCAAEGARIIVKFHLNIYTPARILVQNRNALYLLSLKLGFIYLWLSAGFPGCGRLVVFPSSSRSSPGGPPSLDCLNPTGNSLLKLHCGKCRHTASYQNDVITTFAGLGSYGHIYYKNTIYWPHLILRLSEDVLIITKQKSKWQCYVKSHRIQVDKPVWRVCFYEI